MFEIAWASALESVCAMVRDALYAGITTETKGAIAHCAALSRT